MASTARVGSVPAARGGAPSLPLTVVVTLAGWAAAGCTVVIASTGDGSRQLYVSAALADWITLSFIAAGLVAWRRRPGSGLGRLMVAAGFVNFLSSLAVGGFPVAYAIGEVFDFTALAISPPAVAAADPPATPTNPQRLTTRYRWPAGRSRRLRG